MKVFLISIFLMGFWSNLEQPNPFIIPELDQAALNLRSASLNGQQSHIRDAFISLRQIWQDQGLSILNANLLNNGAIDDIRSCQNDRLKRIEDAINQGKMDQVFQVTEAFIDEMVQLRAAYEDAYAFDELWEYKSKYDRLNKIIHDQMLDLLEWNEIDMLYDQLDCSWQKYELLYQDLLPVYYPNFDVARQKSIFVEMQTCLDRLRQALDSGFRPDFIVPCDDIGSLIEENLELFLPPNSTDL